MSGGPLRRAIGEPAIRLFVIGSFLSNVGTWIQRIAVGWLVFDLTGSAAWVGLVAGCEVIPSLAVAPFAGVMVDRSDRTRLFTVGQVCALVQASILTVFALAGALGLEVIVAAAVALGVIEGFNQPTRLAIVSDVAPRELIRPAVSLNSLGFNAARFIGPAGGGLALAYGGPAIAFAANAVSFVPLILLVVLLRRKHLPPSTAQSVSLASGIAAGAHYLRNHAALGPIFLMLIAISLSVRSFIELLPAISGIWFDASPKLLSALTSSVGIGAIIGGLWMLRRDSLDAVVSAVLGLPALLIGTMVVFALAGSTPWVSCLLLAVAGFCIVASGTGMQSVIHLSVDPAFRGRVLSLYGLIQRALPAVGAALAGYAVDALGLRVPMFVSLIVAAALWVVVWAKRKQILGGVPPE